MHIASRFRLRIFIALIVFFAFAGGGTAAARDQVPYQGWENCTGCYGPGMMGGYLSTGDDGMMNASGVWMMESLEIRAMGGPLHGEMQGLVTKLRSGNLSSTEQSRLMEIMDEYPGASNLMIARMTGGYGPGAGGYPGMMGWYNQDYGMMGGAGTAGTGLMVLSILLVILFFLVWLVAGILLILWLVRQVRKKERPS